MAITKAKKNYLTQDRYDEIVTEVEQMKTEGRKAVAERLRHAKDLGDLSENAEYQTAREDQSRLEGRINEYEELIRNSSIIKKEAVGVTVRIGSNVKIKKGSQMIQYAIVGSNEAKPLQGFISNESPIGQALLGKKIGEKAYVKAPSGTIEYEIVEIS
ncbi:MAG: transcription elongation factor GreA [Candidatus Paceibacterota bacterium]|jgi:transcription elongation factor GreA